MSTTNLPALVPIPGQLVLIELAEPGDACDACVDRIDRALGGYLAGYSGATLVGYRLDLRQWVNWITNLRIEEDYESSTLGLDRNEPARSSYKPACPADVIMRWRRSSR